MKFSGFHFIADNTYEFIYLIISMAQRNLRDQEIGMVWLVKF